MNVVFGWSPGYYSLTCTDCKKDYIGDVRSFRCKSCANQMAWANSMTTELPEFECCKGNCSDGCCGENCGCNS